MAFIRGEFRCNVGEPWNKGKRFQIIPALQVWLAPDRVLPAGPSTTRWTSERVQGLSEGITSMIVKRKYVPSDMPFVNTVRAAIDVDPLPVQRLVAEAVEPEVLPTRSSTARGPVHAKSHPWNVRASAAYFRKHGRYHDKR